jgi:hypothetical protein
MEDVTHRDPERRRKRPQRLHRRHHPVELDGGDQTRGDTNAASQLPAADSETFTLQAQLPADPGIP